MLETPETQATPTARSFPIARLDLDEELRLLRASPRCNGHSGKTLLREADLRIVLVILDRGAKLPDHHADGSLTIQTLDGRVVVALLDASFDLAPGQMLAVERGVSHSLVAIEDSAILLTIAWRGRQ